MPGRGASSGDTELVKLHSPRTRFGLPRSRRRGELLPLEIGLPSFSIDPTAGDQQGRQHQCQSLMPLLEASVIKANRWGEAEVVRQRVLLQRVSVIQDCRQSERRFGWLHADRCENVSRGAQP